MEEYLQKNSKVSMVNVSIRFVGNYGGKSSAIQLIDSQLTLTGDASVNQTNHLLFSGNNGSTIVCSRSGLNFHEIEMEFVNNTISNVEEYNIITGTVVCADRSYAKFKDTIILFKHNHGGIVAINKTTIRVIASGRSS